MSYRCHTVQEIWGDGVAGAVLCLIDASLCRRYNGHVHTHPLLGLVMWYPFK